jgi:hypothetical protein
MKAQQLIDFETREACSAQPAPAGVSGGVVIERDFRSRSGVRPAAKPEADRAGTRKASGANPGLRPELACFFALARKPDRTPDRPRCVGVLAQLAEGLGCE